jgi:hypothetical protein
MTIQTVQLDISHSQYILQSQDADLIDPSYTGGNGRSGSARTTP